MAKYRKKPVIIEAVQLEWSTWSEMCSHANVGFLSEGQPEGCYVGVAGQVLPKGHTSDELGLLIPTLEGLMIGREHDFIIRGIQDELYPCKPEIFNATYEVITDDKE